MQTSPCLGRNFSKLMLGTVQFGLDYGIANRSGRPGEAEVRAILAAAWEGGVNCLDTAAAYGESEEVLGRALQELNLNGRFTVVSKVRHLEKLQDHASFSEISREIEDSVKTSLRRLRLETLPVCLFHHEVPLEYFEVMERLRDKGLIEHYGASMVDPMNAAAYCGTAEALQIPFNLLDRRFRDTEDFTAVRESGVALFARSVFLQGLIVMPEAEIPPALAAVIPVRRRIAALAEQAGMPVAELALRYAATTEGITCVLVGVDNLEQMRENLTMFDRGPLSADLMKAVDQAVPRLPETVLNPVHWPKKSRAAERTRPE